MPLAAFPQEMNDLEFVDQPIVADVGGDNGGPYVIEASATSDVRAFNAMGQDAPGFPKFTGGWTVNSPVFGPFGDLPDQVLVDGTRDGGLFIWTTPTTQCASSGPWPREHHDLSNTNNLETTDAAASSCALVSVTPLGSSDNATPVAPTRTPAPSPPSPGSSPGSGFLYSPLRLGRF
jgi:hypothetical protein